MLTMNWSELVEGGHTHPTETGWGMLNLLPPNFYKILKVNWSELRGGSR